MADFINLKLARKEKARREREREAAANRLRFGRTKVQKAVDRQSRAGAEKALDGKQLGPNPGEKSR